MPWRRVETVAATMTENRCFPYVSDRGQIGVKNRGIVSTKNPVGLAGCTETSAEGFSDTPPKPLCVPGGRFVSSGQGAAARRERSRTLCRRIRDRAQKRLWKRLVAALDDKQRERIAKLFDETSENSFAALDALRTVPTQRSSPPIGTPGAGGSEGGRVIGSACTPAPLLPVSGITAGTIWSGLKCADANNYKVIAISDILLNHRLRDIRVTINMQS
jgi:hypothetical protein